MKVLMVNGSSNQKGCTFTALSEIGKTLKENGVDYDIFQLGAKPIMDCIGCNKCTENGCVFDNDKVNEFVDLSKNYDAFVFGTPVYYAHASGRIFSFLDRVFYSSTDKFSFKPAAVIASARRAGTTAALDGLVKYCGLANMPVISSTYWNMVHGTCSEEVMEDKEGLQTMRNIARNMAWILKSIDAGKNASVPLPTIEKTNRTNFIR